MIFIIIQFTPICTIFFYTNFKNCSKNIFPRHCGIEMKINKLDSWHVHVTKGGYFCYISNSTQS